MATIKVFRAILFSLVLLTPSLVWGTTISGPDTCTINDDCQNAIQITNVISDQAYVCVQGCNLYASPDSLVSSCQMGDFPTVWYQFSTDHIAQVLNIDVSSPDFVSPVISLFKASNGCDDLQAVFLTNTNMACMIGSAGKVSVIGQLVNPDETYYIAISSLLSIGGSFQLCVSTLAQGFVCVVDRNIEITGRSNGGPLEGPFDPNEKLSFCMNVNQYTAAGNGCQWFQGLVPVFGNGWDPSSFNADGQPGNASINGDTIGEEGNGLYGAATWDWFIDVDYHYNNANLQIGDLDGNGTVEMCNSLYDPYCPNLGGILGGCCGPCWQEFLGTILPPGWFAYGINGTCPSPGPPIRVDWGDGNTCGGPMGPWHFCFDLITRDIPDCLGDSTKKDLSLGFFTFADGETGSWTGSASVCANDHPLKMSLAAKCGRVSTHDVEHLPPLCSGDTLQYEVIEDGISTWDWNISPFWAVPYLENHGENGFIINAPLINETSQPVDITGILIGHETGSSDIVLRKIKFKLNDTETCGIVSENSPHGSIDPFANKIHVYPMPVGESAMLEWTFDLQKSAFIEIYNSQGRSLDKIPVSINDGHQKQIDTSLLSPGIYFITLSNSEFRYVTRMVRM